MSGQDRCAGLPVEVSNTQGGGGGGGVVVSGVCLRRRAEEDERNEMGEKRKREPRVVYDRT